MLGKWKECKLDSWLKAISKGVTMDKRGFIDFNGFFKILYKCAHVRKALT